MKSRLEDIGDRKPLQKANGTSWEALKQVLCRTFLVIDAATEPCVSARKFSSRGLTAAWEQERTHTRLTNLDPISNSSRIHC